MRGMQQDSPRPFLDTAEVERVIPFINRDDAPILAAALQSGADCFVTGKTRHFTRELSDRVGIPIFTPADYLVSLQTNGEDSS